MKFANPTLSNVIKSYIHLQYRSLGVSGVLRRHTFVHDDVGIFQFPTSAIRCETYFKGVTRYVHTFPLCPGVHGDRLGE